MTQDEIIRMAREAGLEQVVAIDPKSGIQTVKCPPLEPLKRFAALVAAHEREACAKVCDIWPYYDVQGLAAAIRARGEK